MKLSALEWIRSYSVGKFFAPLEIVYYVKAQSNLHKFIRTLHSIRGDINRFQKSTTIGLFGNVPIFFFDDSTNQTPNREMYYAIANFA